MKKISILVATMLLVVLSLAGCKKEEHGEYKLYYVDIDVTKLVNMEYSPNTTDKETLIQKMITRLSEKPASSDMRRAIPKDVKIKSVSLKNDLLTIDFNKKYKEMNATEEVLTRAAVVRTLLQVDGVRKICFTVEGDPLTNLDGDTIGYMNEDSFVENPGEQINSITTKQLTLYFANSSGDKLVKETRKVHYSSNISMEKLVIEQLMKGSSDKSLLSTIPKGTQLINVSVDDGVCYVNLDDTFKNQNYEIKESVVIYSIVNSLTELDEVDKVQISINGDTSGVYRYSFKLSKMYSPDYSMVKGPESKEKSKEKNKEKNKEINKDSK